MAAWAVRMMLPTQDLNIREVSPLLSPSKLKDRVPATASSNRLVVESRETIKKILSREDPRMLVVVGPCSIHDPKGALEYASRLAELRRELQGRLFILMRVYFEKPRTTVGWKGLINDPHLDGSYDLEGGIRIARELLLQIAEMGIPAATEFLDPIMPQYTSDLVSWAAIGARTTESQTHRELASGLSMPIGFKNGTDGGLQVAMDAMHAARHPHYFLGIDQNGLTCVVKTKGNPWGHMVLRGGRVGTNYDPESIRKAVDDLIQARLSPTIMVDCSHANSGKKPAKQEEVWKSVIEQRKAGNKSLTGLMVESYLKDGAQPFPQSVEKLVYGVSITDPCLNWESTAAMIRFGHSELGE